MAYYYERPVYVNVANNSPLIRKADRNESSERRINSHRLIRIPAQELVGCNLIYLDRNKDTPTGLIEKLAIDGVCIKGTQEFARILFDCLQFYEVKKQ